MSAPGYVWNEPNRPIAVHLPLDFVSRLGFEAMEAYKSVPHRGLEIGGLLLGRREANDLFIDGFEPVESEHRSGPSYLLSETDQRLFDETLRAHPDAVGIYRTHTRSQSLQLQEDDADLFRRHFTGSDQVFLVIQPATGKAAFFVPENDSLILAHEFPFRAADLAPEASAEEPIEEKALPIEKGVPVAAALPLATLPAAMPPSVTPPLPKPRSRSRWLVPLAAVILGMACGAAVYQIVHRRSPATQTSAAPSAVPVAAPADQPGHVALNVQREGGSLKLLWERDSPVVRSAAKAILYIKDGAHQSQLNLDPQELSSGLISYWPDTNDVTFRLEVFAAGHSSDDSIRVVGGVAIPQPPTRRIASSRTPPPTDASPVTPPSNTTPPSSTYPQPQAQQQSGAQTPPPEPARSSEGSAARTDSRSETVDARPSPFTPVPKPTPVNPPASALPVAKDPQVWVKVEPVSNSRGLIDRIPLLRRLKRQPQAFEPPAPVREIRPTLTTHERRALVGMVPVDVKVYVADTGKVQFVELLSDSYRHEELASSVIYAARRWEFSPARLGQEKVPGEVILHFRFSPEEPPVAVR